MTLSTQQKEITDVENRLVVARGRERGGSGMDGSLGLVDANCDIWSGWAVGPCWTAREPVCDWVTLPYNRD